MGDYRPQGSYRLQILKILNPWSNTLMWDTMQNINNYLCLN